MDLCNDLDFLKTMYLIKSLISILKVMVPLILIIYCTMDIYKMLINTKTKSFKLVFQRVFIGFLVFFIPTFVDVCLSFLGEKGVSSAPCWVNANETTISMLTAKRDAERKIVAEAEEKRRIELQKERERIDKAVSEARDRLNNQIISNGDSPENYDPDKYSDVLFSESGVDGMVTVENGVFYKPSTYTSGQDGTRGSGPYGYNKFFYARLQKFVEDASSLGHTITISGDDYGSWRPYSKQAYYYNCYITKSCNNGNLAAIPGTSNHGWGIASDLSFGSTSAKYWAHDNAYEYGLSFNLCNNVRVPSNCSEDWHIEPKDIVKR